MFVLEWFLSSVLLLGSEAGWPMVPPVTHGLPVGSYLRGRILGVCYEWC